MGTKATRKDFYMEIKKSFGRFMSLFFIVALGVAFFSGIRAAEPAMRVTGDAYFDNSGLMDIKLICTYGITDNNIKAFKQVDGVARVEGSYSADFLCGEDEKQAAMHVVSDLQEMNHITVSEGRLPKETGECLADDETPYRVGDKIKLKSGNDNPVTDTLKTDTLTVVGRGNSPCYISFGRGSTNIGTGSISGFLVVPKQTFEQEVYTEAYIQVDGAKKLTAYTEAYDKRVSDVIDAVEDAVKVQGKDRRQDLIDDAQIELNTARQELEDSRKKAEQELSDAAAKLADGENQMNDARVQITSGKAQLADAKALLVSKQNELDTAKAQYESGLQRLNEGRAAYEQGMTEYGQQKVAFEQQEKEAAAQFQQQRAQLDALKEQCSLLEQEIAAEADEEKKEILRQQLAQLNAQYTQGEAQYIQAKAQADAALSGYRQQLEAGASTLTDTVNQLNASDTQLADAWSQIQSGQSQINAGWQEINTQEVTLQNGEAELAAKEAELNDGKKKYEEGKVTAEQEISDGQQKITDAEREINKIKEPKWYVSDRDTLPEYSGFGDNADRMRAIGRVFPVMFFLVAALISLTTMTRMVEEQRIEIGTMKALGYSKITIASKYLGYAFMATLGGSVFGFLFGEKVLPYIIIYAYGIMYLHLPEILMPYHWGYAAMATSAALLCTIGATLLACYRELSECPSVLMRPPAPKKGTRVLLERVPFIWKRLSFIWKSTVRNLMRYKKRFFMTIIGIGGCMALMLVGFGLRDSILDIGDLQYGQIQEYDGTAYLKEDITEQERLDLVGALKKDSNIRQFMNVYMKNITLVKGENEREAYACIPENPSEMEEYINFQDRITKEKYSLSDKGAIISEKTAKLLGVKAGDTIYVKGVEDEKLPLKTAEICENYMGHYIYFTPNVFEQVYGEKAEYNSIFYESDAEKKKEREKIGQKILDENGVLSVSYLHDIQKQLNDMLKSLNLVIVVLIVSAGMLAFVVLYNLNNVNITERQRELATIKVLGFYDPELAAYVYRENILLTFIGALVGMGMGRLLHLFIIRTVEVDTVMFGRNINQPSYLYSLLFTIAFSVFVNGVMYFKLKKIDMVESLKSIE